jgi:hypothetical protein
MEAKCMGMGVITQRNYGCTLEPYFDLKGLDLLRHLRMSNKVNIEKMKKFLP